MKDACGKNKRKGVVGRSLGSGRVSRDKNLLECRKVNWKIKSFLPVIEELSVALILHQLSKL